ncbi:hypothetical protein LPJ57_005474 [Coemansia sp. RSA 486]|nr:hypothetical protein LPJ57_005474 [Coemansia sp. RSA 486]KAJ2232386.1 hypothetical protein IWW45_005002 [Coemansia sp. RSA 485]
MKAHRYFLETNTGAMLRKQLAAPDPQLIQIPDISFCQDPAVPVILKSVQINSQEEVQVRFVNVVSRPNLSNELFTQMQKSFEQQHQAASSISGLGIFQWGAANCMASGLFLRGCKGIGKSYLLLQTAIKLLVREERRTKVVYIGNCSAWVRCLDDTQRRLFLARALRHAFFDDLHLLEIVARWSRNVMDRTAGYFSSDIATLLHFIGSYCRSENIDVAFLVDKADALAGDNSIDNRSCGDILELLLHIKRTPCFTLLLAASDDSKAERVNIELGTISYHVQPLFSSSEAVQFVKSHKLGKAADIWLIKELVNKTWRHPQQLLRLCDLLKETCRKDINDIHADDILSAVTQLSELPFMDFEPSPFALVEPMYHMPTESIGRSVLGILKMDSSFCWPVDANYMSMVRSDKKMMYMYPSPQIAKGLIEYYCGSSNNHKIIDEQLLRMRMAIYQTFG